MNKRRTAWLLTAIGVAAAVGGFGLIYLPAVPILGGLALAAIGLFAIDDGVKP